jgi:hypothetical protein
MDGLVSLQNLLLAPFLLICFLFVVSVFFPTSSNNSPQKNSLSSNNLPKEIKPDPPLSLNGQSYSLLCALEDAPQSALKGQFYSLMSPLACLFEDAPQSALKGQCYELAYPLMSPLACIVTQTWHNFYRQYLGKVNINYWYWKDKPESHSLCEELTNLFQLPKPSPLTQKVIKSFEKGAKPCFQGYRQNFWQQIETYGSFFHWHQTGVNILGESRLMEVYQVCYNTSAEQVNKVINHLNQLLLRKNTPWWVILNVEGKASSDQVEIAYKNLLKKWHPDLNHHPYSHHITARINLAYEQYEQYKDESINSTQNRREKLNRVWKKFEKTIKILWKQHLIPLVYRQ